MATAKSQVSGKPTARRAAKDAVAQASAVKGPDSGTLERRSELIGLVIVGAALIFGAALWSFAPADLELVHTGRAGADQVENLAGPVGARLADLLLQLFGFGAWALDGALLWMGMRTLLGRNVRPDLRTSTGLFGVVLASLVLLHLAASGVTFRPWGKDAAGLVGSAVAEVLRAFLSTAGTAIVALVLLVAAISALTEKPLLRMALRTAVRLGRAAWRRASGQTRSMAGSGVAAWKEQRAQRAAAKAEEKARQRELKAELRARDVLPERDTRPRVGEPTLERDGLAAMPDIFREDGLADDTLPEPAAQAPLVDTRRLATSSPAIPKVELGPDGFPNGTSMAPPVDMVPTAVRLAKKREAAETQDKPRIPPPPGQPAEVVELPPAIARQAEGDQDNPELEEEYVHELSAPSAETQERVPRPEGATATAAHPPAAAPGDRQGGATTGGARIVETPALTGEDDDTCWDAPETEEQFGPLSERLFQMPAVQLVQAPPERQISCDATMLRDNAAVLEQKLADFKIQGEVTDIRPGPVVTTYEYRPAAGIKISRIVSVKDDLTMSLAALRVRVVAPIPGRDVVGIEVPNKQRQIVYFREVLQSKAWREAASPMTLVLGKDIEGRPVVTDLGKAPHMLVAGATGTGKSVGINSFLCSMLYKATPRDLRLLLIDPKVIELAVYEDIPHLLLPVISDMDKAELALKWAVREMERRYQLLASARVRNVAGYNAKVPEINEAHETKRVAVINGRKELVDANAPGAEHLDRPPRAEHLPRIVVVIDEFADLIMQCGKEVERAVARLAQKARAAGIHVILATQRPSTDVITGMIKANFPTRLSFQVASSIDSKVVLNSIGAESLLGNGDMLFLPPGSSALRRCHGTWITDDEVVSIAKHWRTQGKPEYDMDILADPDAEPMEEISDKDLDPLYDDAVSIALEAQQASVSFLQRRLNIGYGRAARIVDHMEARGVVGPQRGPNKPREILLGEA